MTKFLFSTINRTYDWTYSVVYEKENEQCLGGGNIRLPSPLNKIYFGLNLALVVMVKLFLDWTVINRCICRYIFIKGL